MNKKSEQEKKPSGHMKVSPATKIILDRIIKNYIEYKDRRVTYDEFFNRLGEAFESGKLTYDF